MNAAHLHLLLNHAPTVGTVAAVGLLLLAFVRRNESLKHVALEVLVVIAIVSVPVYITGVGAARALRQQPDVSDFAMRLHQDVALWGFTFLEFAGFAAWVALWKIRCGGAARASVAAATLLSILALAVMARAANLGGEIRHPEIRAGSAATPQVAEDDPQQFIAGQITQLMVTSRWAMPAGETLHFLGMSLSFGVLLAVNLRILGVMRQVPWRQVHRLLPWGMLGFGVNLITGMLFFVGQPGQYVDSPPFFWKVVFLMIAGGNFLYLTVFSGAWAREGWGAGLADKAMAVVSLASWVAILYAGRMLPFLGNAF